MQIWKQDISISLTSIKLKFGGIVPLDILKGITEPISLKIVFSDFMTNFFKVVPPLKRLKNFFSYNFFLTS